MRFTDDWVELWHPRHATVGASRFEERLRVQFEAAMGSIEDGWSRMTDHQWSNEFGQSFLSPKDFTEECVLCPEYRLCNRHGVPEEEQENWLRVDSRVGFQVQLSHSLSL